MEGILWKWTNLWSGWQPRWFVLDNGVLAYYKSQEEVNQGCKGSIKMSVCEIIVNSVDNTRLDLVIPSEQHFYLKTATPQERQQWLVALGSAKASLSARQQKETSSTSPDMLKTKKSELRLYCDLLMQQVHTVKSAATEQSPNPESKHTQINRSTSVDGQQIPNTHSKPTKSHLPNDDQFGHDYLVSPRLYEDDSSMMIINTLSPYDAQNSPMVGTSLVVGPSSSCLPIERRPSLISAEDPDDEETWADTSDNENNNQGTKEEDLIPDVKEEIVDVKMNTFFSNLKVSFLNLPMDESQGIPTKHFLDSCAIVITIFEMFGSPIFAPMRIDVMGNLKKITEKYNVDPNKFAILQDIVRYEMESNTTTVRNSATDALMWLKRGLEFVYEFLLEFAKGNPDLKNCALNAYNRTLKQYHGWIVRSVISAATHTVPSRHEVLLKLALNPEDIHNPLYEEQLKDDARRFIKAMDNIIKILNDFYITHKLDKKYIV